MKNDPLIEILNKELIRRKAKNGSYSLRSFSRDLGLDASNLSKILKYQAHLGPSLRQRIGQQLGFENEEIQALLKPNTYEKTTDEHYQNHSLDVFKIVAEWQHYALLEYFKLKKASTNSAVIAKHFGLTKKEIEESLKRLIDVGLLQKSNHGYRPTEDSSSSILNVATSSAHKQQQTQILEGAIHALKEVPIEERSQSSMTVAIDSKKLSEAKELIKTFRRDLGRLLSKSKELDSVYQISISLYPVTKK